MSKSVLSRWISILLVTIFYVIILVFFDLGIFAQIIINPGVAFFVIFNLVAIKLEGHPRQRTFDILAMFTAHSILLGLVFVEILIFNTVWIPPLWLYIGLSLSLIVLIANQMSIVDKSLAVLFTFPLVIIVIGAKLLVGIIDILVPQSFQKLVPYIEVTRELIVNISQALASEERLETEKAINTLGEVSERVDDIAEGYALRKGLGQGIDLGLTFVVFIGAGVLTVMEEDLKIPKQVIFALFASLGLALSTFAGFFGPFYGLAGKCKEFTLKHGNYRGAAFYKAIEQLFAIPFMAASAGFLLLDLPPIDSETLEDFKGEMQEQITEISDNINSLIGGNSSAIPRKTRKMIAGLMQNTEQSLSKLDFRNIRQETNREFALTYYQHEFSWKPWKRKSAVKEFADQLHFGLEDGEHTLRLIGFKINAGQMDDDMVSNVMVSAALRGVIMMEEKYQELFEDVELGQTCTGLAFGARQFLEDHYVVRKGYQTFLLSVRNFFMGLFAVPIVILMSLFSYANTVFDNTIEALADVFFEGRGKEIVKIRTYEIYNELNKLPAKISATRKKRKVVKKTEEEKAQRSWQIRRRIGKMFSMIWEVIVFPFMIIFNVIKWIYYRIVGTERSARELFEEAVSHAALVAMYKELYNKLVMQTHLSSSY